MNKFDDENISEIYIIDRDKILLKNTDEKFTLPRLADFSNYINLQRFDENYWMAALEPDSKIPPEFFWKDIKAIRRNLPNKAFHKAGLAAQLLNWDLNTKYCGYCGNKTNSIAGERGKRCTKCGLIEYPKISPAVIVAILRDDKLLLAHNANFPDNLYSVIAGFLNPGETFEECVAREVMEEVGIRIKNIKYFGNQPWPYPDSQMIAFTAEYDSGEISEDKNEIIHAAWFGANELPHIPAKGSISRKLIDWFKERQQQ